MPTEKQLEKIKNNHINSFCNYLENCIEIVNERYSIGGNGFQSFRIDLNNEIKDLIENEFNNLEGEIKNKKDDNLLHKLNNNRRSTDQNKENFIRNIRTYLELKLQINNSNIENLITSNDINEIINTCF